MRKLISALKTMNASHIHEEACKEASRQVREMETWMKRQVKLDPDSMNWYYEENSVFKAIKESRKYLNNLYTRNKKVTEIVRNLRPPATVAEDEDTLKALRKQEQKLQDEQYALTWRILFIYCAVRDVVNDVLGTDDDNSFKEFEYDPEKYG